MSDAPELTNERTEWLSLSKAAALLGVHSMTLRRWSDDGRFPSFRTPGGHRRFSRRDIMAYLARQSGFPANQLSATWANTALVETRQQVAHQKDHLWLKAVDKQDLREAYRELGHQLMGLLLQYIAAEEPNGTFVEEAKHIGRLYGAYGRRAGLSLTSILEATLFFRDILVESSMRIPTATSVETDGSLRILRRVNQIINAVQLAVTDYYEKAGR